jgi:hypothetical protein
MHNIDTIIDNFYDEYFYHHRKDHIIDEPNDCYIFAVCEKCNISVEFPCNYKNINTETKERINAVLLKKETQLILGIGD